MLISVDFWKSMHGFVWILGPGAKKAARRLRGGRSGDMAGYHHTRVTPRELVDQVV